MLKSLAQMRLGIAYRQFGEHKKSFVEFDKVVRQENLDIHCRALAHVGKMITLIKEIRDKGARGNGGLLKMAETVWSDYNEFKSRNADFFDEDYFTKFYVVRYIVEVLHKRNNDVDNRLDDIIKNVSIPIYQESSSFARTVLEMRHLIGNVPTTWSPDVLANWWEVLGVCYVYNINDRANNRRWSDICFRNAISYAKSLESQHDSPTVFSEYWLRDIRVAEFIKEIKYETWKELVDRSTKYGDPKKL